MKQRPSLVLYEKKIKIKNLSEDEAYVALLLGLQLKYLSNYEQTAYEVDIFDG